MERGQSDGLHVSPIGIARITTFATPPILPQESVRRFLLWDESRVAGEVIENEVQTLASVLDVVVVFARLHASEAGEILCCTLNFLYRANVIAGPVHTVFVALRGCERGKAGEGGEDLHLVSE